MKIELDHAIAEMENLIKTHYPSASFIVSQGEDPEGTYLTATVDVEDTDEVIDLYIDRLVSLQVDEGLPLYVIPVRPLDRIAQLLKARPLPAPLSSRQIQEIIGDEYIQTKHPKTN